MAVRLTAFGVMHRNVHLRCNLGRICSMPVAEVSSCAPATNLAALLVRDGYLFQKSWHPEKTSGDIATHCGRQLKYGRDDLVHQLTPRVTSGLNHYSGIFGLGAFPFHTDMAHWREPPRYMMLRCVKGHGGVSTDILDSRSILDSVGRSELSRALVKPRRPLNGLMPLMSLFRPQSAAHDALFRWDDVFLVPASPAGKHGMALVKVALPSLSRASIVLENPGDTLWIDNWRVLHGRSKVDGTQTDRLIARAYFGEIY
jgi:L-asparagine oxygenase